MKTYNRNNLPKQLPNVNITLFNWYFKSYPDTKHLCVADFNATDDEEVIQNGVAIEICYDDGDKLFVTNGEYGNAVNFCPFCGLDSKNLRELGNLKSMRECGGEQNENHKHK